MRDRKYIERFQAGDYDAFWVLYERYIDQIFAYIYRKTSDRETAEDICSKVWMKVLKSLEFFGDKENANFKAWIYCIANNTVIDYYRTKKEKVDITEIIEPGITPNFASQIDAKDRLAEVIKFLDTLWDIEKEIFILRVWDDMSYKHIAKLLTKKEDACKKSFSRTLEKIKANISLLSILIFLI